DHFARKTESAYPGAGYRPAISQSSRVGRHSDDKSCARSARTFRSSQVAKQPLVPHEQRERPSEGWSAGNQRGSSANQDDRSVPRHAKLHSPAVSRKSAAARDRAD